MNKNEIKITNIEEVAPLLDDRGISIPDIQETIAFEESSGKKFCHCNDQNRSLVRARLGKFNVYADYSPDGDGFLLHSAYSHRIMLASDKGQGNQSKSGTKSEWKCDRCQIDVEDVEDIVIHYNEVELPSIDGMRCPQCNVEMLTETTVMTMLFMAEMMLEAK